MAISEALAFYIDDVPNTEHCWAHAQVVSIGQFTQTNSSYIAMIADRIHSQTLNMFQFSSSGQYLDFLNEEPGITGAEEGCIRA